MSRDRFAEESHCAAVILHLIRTAFRVAYRLRALSSPSGFYSNPKMSVFGDGKKADLANIRLRVQFLVRVKRM